MIDYERQAVLFNDLAQVGRNPPKHQRRGQAIFNHVADGPFAELANKIRGTAADCFYDDKKIPLFLAKLYELCNPEEPLDNITVDC